MLKYTFLVYHQEYITFLDKLREMGMVHIVEKQGEQGEAIRDRVQFIGKVEKAVRQLQKLNPDSVFALDKANHENGKTLFEEFDNLESKLEQHKHHLAAIQKEINEVRPWGHFNLEDIRKLQENGLITRFYSCSTRQFNPEWADKYAVNEISSEGGYIYFVVFAQEGEIVDIQAEEVRLPSKSLSQLESELSATNQEISTVETRFAELSKIGISDIERYRHWLIETLEYDKTLINTHSEAEDKLKILEGWIPSGKEAEMNSFLDSQGVVFVTQKPKQGDKVPIMLKNNKFAKKFEQLGELYSLPKYGELDLTPFFAPFYMLFFGFCLGDTGYGILMAIASLIFHRKVGKDLKPILMLVFYLALSTILFGLIGGTFFGINLYETNLPIYRDLQVMFKAKNTDINNILFYLSLVLGGIQIIFGMILKAVNECRMFGWKLAVGTIGWIFLILGMIGFYALKTYQVLPEEILNIVLYVVLGVGGFMILVINNLNRNPLINVGVGLWDSYNMITGILGDLLSYIRLFALGISSAILGFVFNSLALSMAGSVVGVFFMIIVLVVGHSINLFMSGLGSFVHPMRLTFVEFYKNAGFSGGGKKYNPFRKLIQ
jgi:V/A-type H+-transporting ATPase subunit I